MRKLIKVSVYQRVKHKIAQLAHSGIVQSSRGCVSYKLSTDLLSVQSASSFLVQKQSKHAWRLNISLLFSNIYCQCFETYTG
jgi:hypothetical protein